MAYLIDSNIFIRSKNEMPMNSVAYVLAANDRYGK